MKLPAFIDSHMHLLGLGYINFNIDLTKAKSIKDIIKLIINSNNKKFVIGRGWNQENLVEKRFPTKKDLNLLSRDFPIVLVRVCGHVLVVNDKMLEIAGIDLNTRQIIGGQFSFETGIFSEKAINMIYEKLPKPNKQDLRKYFIKADKILLSNGITSVASDDFSVFGVDYQLVIETIKELYNENLLKVRITEQVNLNYDLLNDFIEKGYVNKQFGKLRMGPLKILADGSLGGKTAYLNNAYRNDPNNKGIRTFTDDELFKLVHLANQNGMDVAIHAIGDGAIDQALTTLIKSIKLTKRFNHNHAIIHAQLATNRQINLMKKWAIGAIIQPIFLNSDIPIIKSRIGDRYLNSYLFKTMYDNKINVGFSTDSPVEPVNPFYNIYCSITRKSIKFTKLEPFLEAEGYDLKSALKCYTTNNLRYTYQLKNNDHIVIDKNILECSFEDIKNIKVLETYIDNKLVYKL